MLALCARSGEQSMLQWTSLTFGDSGWISQISFGSRGLPLSFSFCNVRMQVSTDSSDKVSAPVFSNSSLIIRITFSISSKSSFSIFWFGTAGSVVFWFSNLSSSAFLSAQYFLDHARWTSHSFSNTTCFSGFDSMSIISANLALPSALCAAPAGSNWSSKSLVIFFPSSLFGSIIVVVLCSFVLSFWIWSHVAGDLPSPHDHNFPFSSYHKYGFFNGADHQ